MKKITFIAIILSSGLALFSCGSDVKRNPNDTYMPDMAWARSYKTYAERDSNVFTMDTNQAGKKIFYNNLPVAGTVARGKETVFHLPKDKTGDTTNYVAAKAIANPVAPLNAKELKEAYRLYQINCGICHGSRMDGNGPLYRGGEGPFKAAPKNLVSDAMMLAMPEGQMFYSITYGKNTMGGYASQLTTKQRWQIIHLIKAYQAKANNVAVSPSNVEAAAVAEINY